MAAAVIGRKSLVEGRGTEQASTGKCKHIQLHPVLRKQIHKARSMCKQAHTLRSQIQEQRVPGMKGTGRSNHSGKGQSDKGKLYHPALNKQTSWMLSKAIATTCVSFRPIQQLQIITVALFHNVGSLHIWLRKL